MLCVQAKLAGERRRPYIRTIYKAALFFAF